jgi:hypothetical protein
MACAGCLGGGIGCFVGDVGDGVHQDLGILDADGPRIGEGGVACQLLRRRDDQRL